MMFLLALAASASDPAPASAPAPVSATAPAPDYVVGTTTIDQVRTKLGKPASVQKTSDGTTTLIYYSIHAHAKGTAFIPVVGMFAGGAKSSLSYKVFMFGSDGLLKSFTSSDTNSDCSGGLQGVSCH